MSGAFPNNRLYVLILGARVVKLSCFVGKSDRYLELFVASHDQTKELTDYGMPKLKHEELDQIAAKVTSYLRDRTRRIRIEPSDAPELGLKTSVSIHFIDQEWFNGIRNKWSLIFLDSPAQFEEISRWVSSGLFCPKSYVDGVLHMHGSPDHFRAEQNQAPVFKPADGGLVVEQAFAEASVRCLDTNINRFNVYSGYKEGLMRIGLKKNETGDVVLDPFRTYTSAITPPDIFARSMPTN